MLNFIKTSDFSMPPKLKLRFEKTRKTGKSEQKQIRTPSGKNVVHTGRIV